MSQQTIIEITTTDELVDEEGKVAYRMAQFSGADWKLSIAEGFAILNARNGIGKVVVPAWRMREIEVIQIVPTEVGGEEWTETEALLDANGNPILTEES